MSSIGGDLILIGWYDLCTRTVQSLFVNARVLLRLPYHFLSALLRDGRGTYAKYLHRLIAGIHELMLHMRCRIGDHVMLDFEILVSMCLSPAMQASKS